MNKAVPMVCLVCKHTENYFGRLVFPQETEAPTCPNHAGADPSLAFPLTPVNIEPARIGKVLADL